MKQTAPTFLTIQKLYTKLISRQTEENENCYEILRSTTHKKHDKHAKKATTLLATENTDTKQMLDWILQNQNALNIHVSIVTWTTIQQVNARN